MKAAIMCDSTSYAIWKFRKASSGDNNNNNNSSNFKDIEGARKVLVIDRVKFSDEGVYKCTGTDEFGRNFSALSQLIVIGL